MKIEISEAIINGLAYISFESKKDATLKEKGIIKAEPKSFI